MRPALVSIPLLVALSAASAATAACPDRAGCRTKAREATPTRVAPKRFEPYDPDRALSGSRPGFVDVGGGTELRVGGRTQVEYGITR